ncbi:MAG: hypothetical protein ACRDBQ_15170 [Shewanella sp.]
MMIDLDEYDKLYMDDYFCRSDLKKLVERTRQAEKDAARYRWLRDEANKSIATGPAVAMVGCDGSVMMREHGVEFLVCSNELDAAVDEAMQCNK